MPPPLAELPVATLDADDPSLELVGSPCPLPAIAWRSDRPHEDASKSPTNGSKYGAIFMRGLSGGGRPTPLSGDEVRAPSRIFGRRRVVDIPMVEIDVAYLGELRCRATHGPSGTELTTDAPRDNQGKGESFSPTDLVATALGTCMLTVMGIAARKKGFDLAGAHVHVSKIMTAAPPRRIARLEVSIAMPLEVSARLDEAGRAELFGIAESCPVRLSLLPAIEVPVVMAWGGG